MKNKHLLEGKNAFDPETRIRAPDEKRGLQHPDNPVKYHTPPKDLSTKKTQIKKQKPLTAVEILEKEDAFKKKPPRIYRMPKGKTASQIEAEGKSSKDWRNTLQNGMPFSMYPNHLPDSPVSVATSYVVSNKKVMDVSTKEGQSKKKQQQMHSVEGDDHDELTSRNWTTGISTASFHHYSSPQKQFVENKNKFGFGKGTYQLDPRTKRSTETIASQRYNVQKVDEELSGTIDRVYKRSMSMCETITTDSNRKSVEVYKRLLFKIRWASPAVPDRQVALINDYIMHLLGPPDAYGRRPKFRGEGVMRAGFHKHVATEGEKCYTEILSLINRIRSIVLYNDGQVSTIKSNLTEKQGKMIVQKSSTLRWKMEANLGRRDRFWTSWFFASRGMPAELNRHLAARKKESLRMHLEQYGGGLAGEEGWKQKVDRDDAWKRGDTLNDCDERDPDFGLTALHYGSKQSNVQVVKILLEHGANPNIRGPDGRTALHFAAAYSTREVCLELLGAEADMDAVDEYGCQAIHLAEQNENRATFVTLEKWKHLVPSIAPVYNATIGDVYQVTNLGNSHGVGDGDGDGSISTYDGSMTVDDTTSVGANTYANHNMSTYDIKTYIQIPDEYKPMEEERISKMTRPLRALAYRLKVPSHVMPVRVQQEDSLNLDGGHMGEVEEKENAKAHIGNVKEEMDPMVELRLCTKVAEGCLKEGFIPEAIQVLRRRWKLAKSLLRENTINSSMRNSDLTYNDTFPSRSLGLEGSTVVSMDHNMSAAASAVLQKHGFKGTLSSSTFTLHACIEMGKELAEILAKYNQEGFAATILSETFLLTNEFISRKDNRLNRHDSPNPSKNEKYDGLWSNNGEYEVSTASVHQASINIGGGANDSVTDQSLSITSQFLDKTERMKSLSMSNSLGNIIPTYSSNSTGNYDHMEPSIAVALLARRCEMLLCVWDHLLIDKRETPRTSPFPLPAQLPESMLNTMKNSQLPNHQQMATDAAGVDNIIFPPSHENNTAYDYGRFDNSVAVEEAQKKRTINNDGSVTTDIPSQAYYNGKGVKNTTRGSGNTKIDGSNYATYAETGTSNMKASVRSGNQQAYNYSSTYKDYVNQYLQHQAEFVEELKQDLLSETQVTYEPLPTPTKTKNTTSEHSSQDPIFEVAAISSIDTDYNHKILVDNQGNTLAEHERISTIDEESAINSVHLKRPLTPSVTFDPSLSITVDEKSTIEVDMQDGSSAWYDPNFIVSPGKIYSEKLHAPEPNPPPEFLFNIQSSTASASISFAESQSREHNKTMADLQAQESFISYGYDGEDYQLYQRILGVAAETRICAENAINIVLQTTSHLLVEPYVLAPILEILAECFERESNFEDSLACLVRAETITRRTLGTYTPECCAIMTNVLRMLIKCETNASHTEAVHKANELTRVVDRLSQQERGDKDAITKAKQREKDLGRNFIINPDGSISLNPDRPSFQAQRQEKVRRTQLGLEEDSSIVSVAETSVDTQSMFNAAIELISLGKLLESGYEKMDNIDCENPHSKFLKARELPDYYSVSVDSSGVIKPNPLNKKNKAKFISKEKHVKTIMADKKGMTKKRTDIHTGRAPPVEDISQKLNVATNREILGYGDDDGDSEVDPDVDGGISMTLNKNGEKIKNPSRKVNANVMSTKSASLMPHEHINNMTADIMKQKKKVMQDDGSYVLIAPQKGKKGKSLYDNKDNTKNNIATDVASTSINCARFLQRKKYLEVNSVPILERRRVFDIPVMDDKDENKADNEEVSSKYYKQLQDRALVLDIKPFKLQTVSNENSMQSLRSMSGSNPLNRSINNTINNSLSVGSNADGNQKMTASGMMMPLSNDDIVFDASLHGSNHHTYNNVEIRDTPSFNDGPGTTVIRPRVFEKKRTVGPSRSTDVITNLEVISPEKATAVQRQRDLENFESIRYMDSMEEEKKVFENQERTRIFAASMVPKENTDHLPLSPTNDSIFNQNSKMIKTKPWTLPRPISPPSPPKEDEDPGDTMFPQPSNETSNSNSNSNRFNQLGKKDSDIDADEMINSPYNTAAVNTRATASTDYDSKYGKVAELKREERRQLQLIKEQQKKQSIENAATIAAAVEEAKLIGLNVRVHPLAELHASITQEDPILVLEEQEKKLVQSKNSITSLLKSHPMLAGLLPQVSPQNSPKKIVANSNIVTTTMQNAKSLVDIMKGGVPIPNASSIDCNYDNASDKVDMSSELYANAAKYVGSIMSTSGSLESIPKVHMTLTGDVATAIEMEKLHDLSVPNTADTNASRGSRPSSRITKKLIAETKNSTLRFKQGEWRYTNQTDAEINEELAATDIREVQQSLDAIQEERIRNEPVKWHV